MRSRMRVASADRCTEVRRKNSGEFYEFTSSYFFSTACKRIYFPPFSLRTHAVATKGHEYASSKEGRSEAGRQDGHKVGREGSCQELSEEEVSTRWRRSGRRG